MKRIFVSNLDLKFASLFRQPSDPSRVAAELAERNQRHFNEWRLRMAWHREGTYRPINPYRDTEAYLNERWFQRRRVAAREYLHRTHLLRDMRRRDDEAFELMHAQFISKSRH